MTPGDRPPDAQTDPDPLDTGGVDPDQLEEDAVGEDAVDEDLPSQRPDAER